MEKKAAVDVFSQWALIGKDEGMERGHAASVQAMLELAIPKLNAGFSAIDLGCGNGWVTRLLSELGAGHSEGVDGSNEMVNKATSRDSNHKYSLGLLPDWSPGRRFDLVHTMEFLYYLDDPAGMLSIIHDEWLEENGILVAGVDHYLEHEESLTWPEHVGVHMTTLSEKEWLKAFKDAGFEDLTAWRAATKEGFVGTLVIGGKKAD